MRVESRAASLPSDDVPELERLSVLQKQFEAEAKICADGGAYHAAAVMIGSAIEAALLFCLLEPPRRRSTRA